MQYMKNYRIPGTEENLYDVTSNSERSANDLYVADLCVNETRQRQLREDQERNNAARARLSASGYNSSDISRVVYATLVVRNCIDALYEAFNTVEEQIKTDGSLDNNKRKECVKTINKARVACQQNTPGAQYALSAHFFQQLQQLQQPLRRDLVQTMNLFESIYAVAVTLRFLAQSDMEGNRGRSADDRPEPISGFSQER
jgi:hypothetical protein